jgi:hypothetical protein
MRILGHIPHPVYHITVFKMENKLSIQFEFDDFAQTYKYKGIENLENLQQAIAFVSPELLTEVAQIFNRMHMANYGARTKLTLEAARDYDDII